MSIPQHASPSMVGVDPVAIRTFVDATETVAEMHTLGIGRRGARIVETAWAPYQLHTRQLVYSVSKSLTAMAVGSLLTEPERYPMAISDPILAHLPTPGIDVDPSWQHVTVEHCLAMATGHSAEAWQPAWRTGLPLEAPLLDLVLAHPPDQQPGTVFAYNQVATYLLGRMVTHLTGSPLRTVVHERVLHPLGLAEPGWFTEAEGNDQGWSGAHVQLEDLLRLGQCWLDGGSAPSGQQLVPAWFLAQATTGFIPMSSDEWTQGYGYSFWILEGGFRADGAFGQFIVVIPSLELVVAITSAAADMHALGRLILTHLVPGVGPIPDEAALLNPPTTPGDAELAAFLATRSLPLLPRDDTGRPSGDTHSAIPTAGISLPVSHTPPAGSQVAPPAAPVAGITHVTAPVEPANTASTTEPLILTYADQPLRIAVGTHDWRPSVITAPAGPYAGDQVRVHAQGGWHEGCYRAELRLLSTPHHAVVTVEGERATVIWPLAPLHGTDLFASSPTRAGLQ